MSVHEQWQIKLAADPWNGWRALLKGWEIDGTKVPVDPNTPFTGYYRTKRKDKTFAAVAYWLQDGKWMCLIDGQQVSEDRAIEQWPYISRYPISRAWYVQVAEKGEPWPDVDERAAPTIGDNRPPEETPIESIKAKIENAKGGISDYAKIGDDETLAKAKSLKNRLTELAGEADKIRKAEKEPHLEAGRAVDEIWQPVVKDAQSAAKQISDVMDAYATEKLRLQRQAEAEVERRRRAAEAIEADNARKLREAEAAGKEAPTLKAVPEVAPAPKPSAAETVVRPGYGKAGRVKTEWVVTKIVDIDALFVLLKTHPELRELMMALAQRAKNAGIEPPGVELEERAKVR